MCKHCFDKEFFGFTDLDVFFNLENDIQKKLASKTLKLLKKDSDIATPLIEEALYACNLCNEQWMLSLQEHLKRSFFIKEKHLTKYKNNILAKEKRHKMIFFGVLIVIAVFMSWIVLA